MVFQKTEPAFTVSAEFSAYAESGQGDLLIQSFHSTFCGYIYVDDFNLIIDNGFHDNISYTEESCFGFGAAFFLELHMYQRQIRFVSFWKLDTYTLKIWI